MHRALGDRGCVVLINFRASHEQCCHPLELAVVAGHHINSGEPPDYSSCVGDHSLAKTAFQIRGRGFDGMGCDQIGEIEHGPIIRHASCHLLRGKLAISQGSVRNLLSAATLRATVHTRAIVLKRVCASGPPTTPCAHDITIATDQRGYTPTDGGAVTPTGRRAFRRRRRIRQGHRSEACGGEAKQRYQTAIALGESASIAELDATVIGREQLTPEQHSVLLSGGRQAVVQNRLAWVVTARLTRQANRKSDRTCDINL